MDQQESPSAVSTPHGVSPAAPAKRSPLASVAHWARDLMISVVLAIFVILFIYQPVKVEGTSMMPTLDDQERIFINKFVYRFHFGNIDRGDTVVFWFPGDPSKSYIKRVIGVPGDHIRIVDGTVYVNDQPLTEPYVPSEYFDIRSMVETTVPEDSYFVLGDHRSMSQDSREFGPVSQNYIFGKAVLVYWPVDKLSMVR